MKVYNCRCCKLEFSSRKGCATRTPKFCSRKCSSTFNCARPEVRAKMSQAKIGRTPHNKKPTVITKCLECGTVIYTIATKPKKYCGFVCRNLAYKKLDYSHFMGANSHFWKGGVTVANELQRKSAKYRDWRKAVFGRDNYTCQFCYVRGSQLQADHIKPFAYYPKLRFDIDNGRTLCVDCHYKTSTYGTKARLTISGEKQVNNAIS